MLSALEWSEAAYDKRTLWVIYNWATAHCFSHLGGGENISYQIFMKRQFCWAGELRALCIVGWPDNKSLCDNNTIYSLQQRTTWDWIKSSARIEFSQERQELENPVPDQPPSIICGVWVKPFLSINNYRLAAALGIKLHIFHGVIWSKLHFLGMFLAPAAGADG